MNKDSCQNHFLITDPSIRHNAKKVLAVLIITFLTMFLEIYFGHLTGSMSLLADGWHMATHAAALGITYITYRLATNSKMAANFNFGGGKIIALGGFTSSLILVSVFILIGYESIVRLLHPVAIEYDEALFVAILGLAINIICAFILRDSHHTHDHDSDHSHGHNHDGHNHDGHNHSDHKHEHLSEAAKDHNIRGAYLHVLADALTSVGAIAALLTGKYYNITSLDPIIGLISSLVIFKWAIDLIRDTGWELLDGHATAVNFKKLKSRIEEKSKIIDLHVWKIAPKFLACELIVQSTPKLGLDHYRKILQNEFHILHSVIEER